MTNPRSHPQQVEVNLRAWRDGAHVHEYDHRRLRPAEIILLARHHGTLSGRVLEVGVGGGRILGYLVALGGEVHGIDIAPEAIDHCRRRYPTAHLSVGNLLALDETQGAPFDAIVILDNTIDVIDDAARRAVLDGARRLLTPDGVLVFSSHNLEHAEASPSPPYAAHGQVGRVASAVSERSLRELVRSTLLLARRRRNRRRLRPLEYRERDHAVLNDAERAHGVLHLYIRRDAQERQLREHGFELLECLDADGAAVDGQGAHSPWLFYVARPDPGA